MGFKGYICLVWLLSASFLLSAVDKVAFDTIQGAKRWDKSKKTWELAVGNPPPLFLETNFVGQLYDELPVERAETRILELPYWPRTDVPFTCVVEIETNGPGRLTMTHRNQRNTIIDQWNQEFTGSGFVKFECEWPYMLMAEGVKYESRYSLSSTRPATLKSFYMYQTVHQIFYLDTPSPYRGILYNRHKADKETYDTIDVQKLVPQPVPILNSTEGGMGFGLLMPIFHQNGCGVLWRVFGEASLLIYANAEASEGKIHRKTFEIGRKDQWRQGFINLDNSWMNRLDAKGFWVGRLGANGEKNLLAEARGENAMLDFVAFIPQSRINLPENHKYKKVEFRYLGTSGLWSRIECPIPEGSTAMGLVNRNPGVQILWSNGKEWKLAEVLRTYLDTSLVVREDSIIFLE